MKMKFKNKFEVTGSVTLLKAFMEELKMIGHNIHEFPPEAYIIVNDFGLGLKSGYNQNSTGRNKVYHLPSDWDIALELASELEEYFKKGDWLIRNYSNGTRILCKFDKFNTCYSFYSSECYNLSDYSHMIQTNPVVHSTIDYRLATDREISEILLKVASIKYPIGARFNTAASTYSGNEHIIKSNEFNFWRNEVYNNFDAIHCKGTSGLVYCKGKWAEVVKNLKIKDYEVIKISDSIVKVGCQEFSKKDLENLSHFLKKSGGVYRYDSKDWSPWEIDKVLEVFN